MTDPVNPVNLDAYRDLQRLDALGLSLLVRGSRHYYSRVYTLLRAKDPELSIEHYSVSLYDGGSALVQI